MQDAVEALGVEHRGDRGVIEQIHLDERRPVGHGRAVALVERVEYDHLVAARDELLGDD